MFAFGKVVHMNNRRYTANRKYNIRKRSFRMNKKSFMIIATFVLFINIFCTWGMVANAKDNADPMYKYYQSYMVEKDDTLLSIAYDLNADMCTDAQIQECVEEMISINSLDHKGTICYGNYIIVPYYSTEYR